MADVTPPAKKTINERSLIGNFVILVLLVIAGWQIYLALPSGTKIQPETKKFIGATFEINTPKNWEFGNHQKLNVEALLLEPNTDGKRSFISNINVVSEETDEDIGSYIERNILVLKNQLQSYKLLGSQALVLQGVKGALIEGKFDQDKQTLQNRQLVVGYKGKIYIVTGTALASEWERYNPIITETLQSFRLK